jgi:ABC-type glycerol-3-phosphate transport system substrate-binding protein
VKVRTVSSKKSRLVIAVVAALAVITAVAVGAGSASAAPGANKGKPQPTPTVTVTTSPAPTPTPTATETAVAGDVQLNCTTSGDYVVARYTSASGASYAGAILTDGAGLDGSPYVHATFGTGDYTKFLLSALPSGVVVAVRMVATDGQMVAWCSVNTGYYDPRG